MNHVDRLLKIRCAVLEPVNCFSLGLVAAARALDYGGSDVRSLPYRVKAAGSGLSKLAGVGSIFRK